MPYDAKMTLLELRALRGTGNFKALAGACEEKLKFCPEDVKRGLILSELAVAYHVLGDARLHSTMDDMGKIDMKSNGTLEVRHAISKSIFERENRHADAIECMG